MKSTIRSKLFLLTYGIILGFIVALIILNNTFLKNYYIHNRQSSLIDSFQEIKALDVNDSSLPNEMLDLESRYNLNVHILLQTTEVPNNIEVGDFFTIPNLYNRIYGSQYAIPPQILNKMIVEYNLSIMNQRELAFGSKVKIDNNFTAYLIDVNSEIYSPSDNYQMLGLLAATQTDTGKNLFYLSTITFSSIEDSIRIFNSFTILIGFIFMILSGLIMYFLSYQFTNPILEINLVADEISKLNFSKKIDVKLDDEIGDLGYSINKMSYQLEKAISELQLTNKKLAKEILHKNKVDQLRKEFIANASHELKTPLTLIMGYAEALKLIDLQEESRNEYVEIILDETHKMNVLVKDLLNLSQIESGTKQFKFKRFSIKRLIEDTVKLFGLMLKEKQISLDINIFDKVINSDYEELESVLSNYISNAINHIDGKRLIKIYTEEINDTTVRVNVENSGNNIPETEINNIWESFYKVDKARTRSYGGQGLGLSIVKTILETLGYDFGVRNVDGGVLFYFDIEDIESN